MWEGVHVDGCVKIYLGGPEASLSCSLGATRLIFGDRVSSWDLGVPNYARLTNQGAPEIYLFLSFQCWGDNRVSPCLAFSPGAKHQIQMLTLRQ